MLYKFLFLNLIIELISVVNTEYIWETHSAKNLLWTVIAMKNLWKITVIYWLCCENVHTFEIVVNKHDLLFRFAFVRTCARPYI